MAQNAMSDESRPVTASLDEKTQSSLAAGPAQRWWILGVVGLAQLMVVLDATIVNIALPSAQRDLGFSNADRQWVVTAYSLAFGSLLLLGGRLSDLVGRRRMLIIGLVGFAAASALGGLVPRPLGLFRALLDLADVQLPHAERHRHDARRDDPSGRVEPSPVAICAHPSSVRVRPASASARSRCFRLLPARYPGTWRHPR